MDFDYQRIKDAESRQREERISSLPIQHPTPMAHPSVSQDPPTGRKPPVKPRRSIKGRPTTQQEAGPPTQAANHKQDESVVKRVAPALVLGPIGPLEVLSPSLRAHTLLWFQRSQLPRLLSSGRALPCWLHGFATRREAEQLLSDKQLGCFLLRLSESKIGFVLSYRGEDRCRHFIVEEEEEEVGLSGGGRYLIAGESSRHGSLEQLIAFYTHNPVGPFNETLTMPCVQTNGSCEDIVRLGEREGGGGEERAREGGGEEVAEPCMAPTAETVPCPPSAPGSVSAEYAVVRKMLRKALSLPEQDTQVPGFVTPPHEGERGADGVTVGARDGADPDDPADTPYARVNKPPREKTLSQNPNPPSDFHAAAHSPNQHGATAGSSSLSSSLLAAEQRYWRLEPLHTYEETLCTATVTPPNPTATPDNTAATPTHRQIDFYAMGRRRDLEGADRSQHHLYSEVTIRGTREGSTPAPVPPPIRTIPASNPTRTVPNLPHRPPPRGSHPQSFGSALPSHATTPRSERQLAEGSASSASSIYEQIPDRHTSSRPQLPPPNPKHQPPPNHTSSRPRCPPNINPLPLPPPNPKH